MRRPQIPPGLMILLVLAVLALVACASPPLQPMTGSGPASAGGAATSDVSKVLTTPAIAFAQPTGTADAKAVTASVERQNTNTAAGESVTGVIFPGTAAYMTLMAADPLIAKLSERIAEFDLEGEFDEEAWAALSAEFTARSEALKETLKGVSPDFGALQVINVMVMICKDNGAAEGETGDEQSKVVAEAMAKVVEATVGGK